MYRRIYFFFIIPLFFFFFYPFSVPFEWRRLLSGFFLRLFSSFAGFIIFYRLIYIYYWSGKNKASYLPYQLLSFPPGFSRTNGLRHSTEMILCSVLTLRLRPSGRNIFLRLPIVIMSLKHERLLSIPLELRDDGTKKQKNRKRNAGNGKKRKLYNFFFTSTPMVIRLLRNSQKKN